MGADDLDFLDQMRSAGVQAYAPGPKTPGEAAAPASRGGKAAAPRAPVPPSRSDPDLARVAAQRDEARQALAQLRADHESLEKAASGLSDRVAQLDGELEQARSQLSGTEGRRSSLEEEVRNLRTELASVTASTSLGQMLIDRGCAGLDEQRAAMAGLVALRAEQLLGPAVVCSSEELVVLLNERVNLVCGAKACQPEGPFAVVQVPADRCEVCGGSDLKVAFDRFVLACASAGVSNLVIVGGSPSYRRQLRDLGAGPAKAPVLNLVSGSVRRPRHKAEADMRRADAVVLWGASILDHATSDQYKGGSVRRIQVAHRGLTGMLAELGSRL